MGRFRQDRLRFTLAAQSGGIDVTTNIFTAVVERCPETGLYVGYVPGFPGAHSQGETLGELNANLKEVVAMILDDRPPESRII